jgi:tRNA threonylcarbamoyladenosine biosynthesis protein TsaE
MNKNFANITENNIQEVCDFLLNELTKPAIVLLKGDLGAGKTTLIRNLLKLMGINTRVHSPTFNLVHEFNLEKSSNKDIHTIYHCDFYRLKDESILNEFFNFHEDSILLIEWPEKLKVDWATLAKRYEKRMIEITIIADEMEYRNYNISIK